MILFLLSFSCNLFKIIPDQTYEKFDPFSQAIVFGKLSRSEKDGIFSFSGFPGVNYDRSLYNEEENKNNYSDLIRNQIIVDNINQYDYFTKEKEIPDGFALYVSHIGGQMHLYSFINQLLPFEKSINYEILKGINAFLIALCLIFFLGWVYRNFGFWTFFVTFILLFLSPWLIIFAGHALWWSVWSLFLPFLVTLLLLERKNKYPSKVSNKHIYIFVFIAVFLKCFFTGFEFITTPLVAIYCPVVYYYWLEKKKFSSFLLFSLKLGIIALAAVFLYMFLLIVQLNSLLGNFSEAINYIINSYTRRTDLKLYSDVVKYSWKDILFSILYVYRIYFKGNAFGWWRQSLSQFFYIYLCIIIFISSAITFFITRKSKNRKYGALLICTWFSILCPFSWFTIFASHSFVHPHLDFIVWYIPFLPFGFLMIGESLKLSVIYFKNKCSKTNGNHKIQIFSH
ncbi:MAG: hypothetical protein ACLVKO_05330 [Dysgonomonas sp.]